MGLFRKDNQESTTKAESAEKLVISSILDKKLSVVGDVTFSGKARIDGKVKGNIKGDFLVLSETATVIGDIDAVGIVCQGRVEGNIKAEKLHAQQEAKINGCLNVDDLTVDSGASLAGEIKAQSKDLRLVQGSSPNLQKEDDKSLVSN